LAIRPGYPPQLAADDRRPALSVWYADNAADTPAFETQMRRKVHERARTQDPELLQTLERAFQYIEGGVLNLYYPDRMGNGCRTLRNGCVWVSKWIMLQISRPQQVALSQSAGAC
jgi:hypothetical protein